MRAESFPAAELLLEFIVPGDSGLRLAPSGVEAVEAVLDALFALPGDPSTALMSIRDLIKILDGPMASPSAARALRRAVNAHPRVAERLRAPEPARARASWQVAPVFGAAAPAGTVPAAALIRQHVRPSAVRAPVLKRLAVG